MASGLIFFSACDLAGRWTVTQGGVPAICHLELYASEVTGADGYSLGGDTASLKRWVPSEPSAWRPTADGIALLEADGLTLMLLARADKDEYRAQKGDGGDIILRRNKDK